MSELIQLLEEDEGLIEYIKRLVKRRLTSDSYHRDNAWTERVIDLSIDEVLDKLDIRSIIETYRSRSERKSQLNENRPPFSETEPNVAFRGGDRKRSSASPSYPAPTRTRSPVLELEKSDDDSVRQSSDCGISEASTVQGHQESHENTHYQVRQISPPRFQSSRSRMHDNSLSRQSGLHAILDRVRHDDSNDSILIYDPRPIDQSSEISKGVSTSQEDKVLVDSCSSFDKEAVDDSESPSSPSAQLFNPQKSELIRSDDSRAISSLGSSSSEFSNGIGVPPRRKYTSPLSTQRGDGSDAETEPDNDSGVSSTHSDLSDTTPDFFSSKGLQSANSPILSMTAERDPTFIAPLQSSPVYEEDFEGSPDRRVRFVPSIVSDVFLTRYKYTEDETLDMFYSNDDTILFSSEYEQEYRMADMHNTNWYDWMMSQADNAEVVSSDPAPRTLQIGGDFLESDGDNSEATETASYSWEHEEGIQF